MNLELNLDFAESFTPENFFFGVANAPYLCEGGFNYPDGIKNSLAPLELSGKWERSGEAVRFWTDYEEQIQLAASLGLNAFRMGLDWSRIQPSVSLEPHAPPAWDDQAVKHYAKIIATLFKYKLEPVITLHHFVHPAWLGVDMWLGDEGPDMLVDFEVRIVKEINARLFKSTGQVMRHFLVYNEPNIVPLSYYFVGSFGGQVAPANMAAATDNMWSRYIKIYDGLYDLFENQGWGEPHVGFTIASMCMYETDKLYFDLLRLRTWGIKQNEVGTKLDECKQMWNKRIGELAHSKLTDEQYQAYTALVGLAGQVLPPTALPKTLQALYASLREKKLDYISLNVYEPFNGPKSLGDMEKLPKFWDFAADGEVYHTFILAENDFNRDLPVYMGENSLGYRQEIGSPAQLRPDGWTRERYLKTYFMEMVKCMREGVPIRGYLYWSLVDDYEWADGYSPRMGLYNYDYLAHHILDTDGLGEPAGKIYAHLIAALRSGDKGTIAKAFTNKI